MVRKKSDGFWYHENWSDRQRSLWDDRKWSYRSCVFQLESSGMKSFMKELNHRYGRYHCWNSLYRPGPMDFIHDIFRKESSESIHYECEQMEEILEPTYGCIVYQEQVMRIVMKLAGYTLGRSDLVRRAMSKKRRCHDQRTTEFRLWKWRRIQGVSITALMKKTANQIWDEMLDLQNMHLTNLMRQQYAVVAYRTAYLRCHYPVEFMAALLTSVLGNTRFQNTVCLQEIRN